jgi:hypothetical protein
MLATPEDKMAGTMSFASLTDAVAVAMKQWSARARNIVRLCSNVFFLMMSLLLKRAEYFASNSTLLVTEKLLAEIPQSYGANTSEAVLPH